MTERISAAEYRKVPDMLKKMMILAILSTGLASCDEPTKREPEPKYESNQAKRVGYFQMCMKLLPAGPKTTQYNDWDEVVSECGSQAYYMAMECVANCRAAK